MNTFGLKKLIYLAFLVVNLSEKVVSSYAQHFPTLLESRFGKKIFDPWRPQPAGAPVGSKIFCQILIPKVSVNSIWVILYEEPHQSGENH